MAAAEAPRPDAPEDFQSLVGLLSSGVLRLSPRLKQVAKFVLNRPEDVALHGIVQLAAMAAVPTSTITRFAKELGFVGFNEMQAVFRERLIGPRIELKSRLDGTAPPPGSATLDLDDPGAVFDMFVRTGVEALLRVREDTDVGDIEAFVRALAAAEAVYILSARGAFGVGTYCFYGLSQVGKKAVLVDNLGTMRAEQLRFAGPRDAVLAMTFDNYTPETVEMAQEIAARGVPLLCLTDNEMSPIARLGLSTLYVREARLGHFRSQVPALILCQTIIASLGRRMDPDWRERAES